MYYIMDNDGFHAASYSIETQEILISFLYVHGCKKQLEITTDLIVDVLNFLFVQKLMVSWEIFQTLGQKTEALI